MRTIAVFMGTDYGYMRQTLCGIAEFIDAHSDYEVFLSPINAEAFKRVRKMRVAGMIGHAIPSSWAAEPEWGGRPIVTLYHIGPIDKCSNVTLDNAACGRLMADHLLANGCRRLAFVGTQYEHDSERLAGFREALEGTSIEPIIYRESIEAAVGLHWQGTPQETKLEEWLKAQPKPLAIVGGNIIYAHAVIDVCRRLGILVPDEVAIVGLGGDDLLARFAQPPLSCAQVPWQEIGYEAAALLIRHVEGQETLSRQIVLPPNGVLVRRSSDVLMSADEDVAAAAKYIRQHVASSSLDVTRVAAHTALSRRSLERRFRRLAGRSVHDEIQRVRLARAKQLMIETEMPLLEVAKKSGVRNLDRLGKLFHQMESMSPSEFRQKNRISQYR